MDSETSNVSAEMETLIFEKNRVNRANNYGFHILQYVLADFAQNQLNVLIDVEQTMDNLAELIDLYQFTNLDQIQLILQ